MRVLVIVVLTLAAVTAATAGEWEYIPVEAEDVVAAQAPPSQGGTSGGALAPVMAETPGAQRMSQPTTRTHVQIVAPELPEQTREGLERAARIVLEGRSTSSSRTAVIRGGGVSVARLNREAEVRARGDEQLRLDVEDARIHANVVVSEALRKAANDAQQRADAAEEAAVDAATGYTDTEIADAVTASARLTNQLRRETQSAFLWVWVAVFLLPILCLPIYHYRKKIVEVARRRSIQEKEA